MIRYGRKEAIRDAVLKPSVPAIPMKISPVKFRVKVRVRIRRNKASQQSRQGLKERENLDAVKSKSALTKKVRPTLLIGRWA